MPPSALVTLVSRHHTYLKPQPCQCLFTVVPADDRCAIKVCI